MLPQSPYLRLEENDISALIIINDLTHLHLPYNLAKEKLSYWHTSGNMLIQYICDNIEHVYCLRNKSAQQEVFNQLMEVIISS